MLRRLLGLLTLAGVAFAAIVVYRRRFAARPERVDLYYEDGSLSSIDEGSAGAERLLPLARDVLRAARA